jgi:hypothetical protein
MTGEDLTPKSPGAVDIRYKGLSAIFVFQCQVAMPAFPFDLL